MLHAAFLGFMAYLDFQKIYGWVEKTAEARGGIDGLTSADGIRALLFGIMLGVSGYVSGVALSASADTIMMMLGLNGTDGATYGSKDYDTLYDMY